jgi:hypothetical protein
MPAARRAERSARRVEEHPSRQASTGFGMAAARGIKAMPAAADRCADHGARRLA